MHVALDTGGDANLASDFRDCIGAGGIRHCRAGRIGAQGTHGLDRCTAGARAAGVRCVGPAADGRARRNQLAAVFLNEVDGIAFDHAQRAVGRDIDFTVAEVGIFRRGREVQDSIATLRPLREIEVIVVIAHDIGELNPFLPVDFQRVTAVFRDRAAIGVEVHAVRKGICRACEQDVRVVIRDGSVRTAGCSLGKGAPHDFLRRVSAVSVSVRKGPLFACVTGVSLNVYVTPSGVRVNVSSSAIVTSPCFIMTAEPASLPSVVYVCS